jgi:hypothetical protein
LRWFAAAVQRYWRIIREVLSLPAAAGFALAHRTRQVERAGKYAAILSLVPAPLG